MNRYCSFDWVLMTLFYVMLSDGDTPSPPPPPPVNTKQLRVKQCKTFPTFVLAQPHRRTYKAKKKKKKSLIGGPFCSIQVSHTSLNKR